MKQKLINIHNLKQHVEKLAGEIGERNVTKPDNLDRAEKYISGQFKSMGYDVMPHEYKARGVISSNLEITKPGSETPNQIILLGAHYDTFKNCPGANDSASGIAVLLEIARMVKQRQVKSSIRFVAFTNEEPPFFSTDHMGSWRYARMARQRGDNIKSAIMLGSLSYYSSDQDSQMYPPFLSFFYPNKGNYIALFSNLRSHGEMAGFSKLFKRQLSFQTKNITVPNIIPGMGWNDHNAFWLHGYKSFMISDTASYRYPFHHSPRDTPEKVNYTRLAEVATAILRTIQLR